MTETGATAPAASGVAPQVGPAKLDPETLALRSRPARAIRFRKGAIIAIAALGSVSLMGIAWMALKPQMFIRQAKESELSQPMSKPASDALSGLPSSYDDAPKLGPPLPGDLGRPILRAQQQAEGIAPSTRVTITPDLQARLQAYAAVYASTYGVEEPVVDLVPAMLAAFLDSDRNFVRSREAAARRQT